MLRHHSKPRSLSVNKTKTKQESKLPTDATYNISLIFKLIIFTLKFVFDNDTIDALYAFNNIHSLNALM